MDATRRTSSLRRVAMMAALAALLVPAGPAAAASTKKVKLPVVTSVSPMKTEVGQTLTLKGRNFRRGKGKNSVAFKSDGAPAVFARADIATTRMLKVKVPARLVDYMHNVGSSKVPTTFRIRVLAKRFSRSFTAKGRSPEIGPKGTAPEPAPPAAAAADGDCDADGVVNGRESDDDNDGLSDDVELSLRLDPCKPDTDADGLEDRWEHDCDRDRVLNRDESDDDDDLLPDDLENVIGTSGCSTDTDGDTIQDGFEYRSAVDLNDDNHQEPQTVLPYPGNRPYPNPLDGADANVDHDGDGLTSKVEQELWIFTGSRTLAPLSYSAGEQHSVLTRDGDGRRKPALAAAGYDKWTQFLAWAGPAGHRTVRLEDRTWTGFTEGLHSYGLLDTDRSGVEDAPELLPLDRDRDGFLSDDERDEDADGLSNYDEYIGRSQPGYWASCYSAEKPYYVAYAGTSPVHADSDGDGVRDGADDSDHDDVPNMMELSRWDASHLDDSDDHVKGVALGGGDSCTSDPDLVPDEPRHPNRYGMVNPFNPCMPDLRSRTCPRVIPFGADMAPFDGPTWWALQ